MELANSEAISSSAKASGSGTTTFDENNNSGNKKNTPDENEIKIIFHVHLPEGIEKHGQPVVLGSVKELGSWTHPHIKLRQDSTYWQSDPITISISNIEHDIHYKYAILKTGKSNLEKLLERIGYLPEKFTFEGNSKHDNRTLDIKRNNQFDIWKNNNDLPKEYRFNSPNDIRDFAFVNYIYDSIDVNNLKDKAMEYQHLLFLYNELTIRVSDIKFILSRIEDKSKERKLFLCLLLGYYIPRQHAYYELSNQFPSESLLDALEGYKKESLPSDTRDQMYTAIMTLVQRNAFQMQFNWLKIFAIASEIDPDYTFIDRLEALKYDNDRLARFIKEVKIIKPYINVNNFDAYAKLAKWLTRLCHDMDSLFEIWSDVLSQNHKIIFKYFVDQVQEYISRDDAAALEYHLRRLPKSCRNNVADVFRDHVLLLLKNTNIEWTDPNISAIQKLLRDNNLWRKNDVIRSLELISQSNNFELLNIFPEVLDSWFNREFSDTKKRIPIICANWFTLLLTKLSTKKKNTSDENNFIFSVFQQLEHMRPLLGQRINVWKDLTTIAVKRVKGCTETQIFSETK